MNIGPTQIAAVTADHPAPTGTDRSAATAPSPASDDVPKTGSGEAGISAAPTLAPDAVVNVHPDTSTGQQILVYEFVNPKSGALIFQIPSEQMLNLVQVIRQRLQQMAAKQSGDGEVKPEGPHGNQL